MLGEAEVVIGDGGAGEERTVDVVEGNTVAPALLVMDSSILLEETP